VSEVARLILILVTLKLLAEAARNSQAAGKCQASLVIVIIALAAVFFLFLVMGVILGESKMSLKTVLNLLMFTLTVGYIAHAGMLVHPALTALETRDALGRRK